MKLSQKSRVLAIACLIGLAIPVVVAQPPAKTNPALPKIEARAKQIAASLAVVPRGPAAPITDREAWDAAAKLPIFRDAIKKGEEALGSKIAPFDEEAYREYFRNGDRSRYQEIRNRRHSPLSQLVIAECLENNGRFISDIAELLNAICDEPSWVYPAHDFNATVIDGKDVYVDLGSAATSAEMAITYYWLGDKLPAAIRDRVVTEIRRRTLEPYQRSMVAEHPLARMMWMQRTNNWNAVCHAGVVTAALIIEPDKSRRAMFIAAAEHYMERFFAGFTPDGYCSEGLSYWNYGFGHFVSLAETIVRETSGNVDLFERPEVRRIAMFGPSMEITPGLFAAFADCPINAEPNIAITAFLSRRLGLGLLPYEKAGLYPNVSPNSLMRTGLYSFPNSTSMCDAVTDDSSLPLRTEFSDAGVLICRPHDVTSGDLAAVFKGGHNAEHHNHNDVGSFVVARGGALPLIDPGGEVYTRRTFSNARYVSQLLNSFGHPVPRINGHLQSTGASRRGKLIQRDSSDAEERYHIDIASAYECPELKTLTREFIYRRNERGIVEIRDVFELTEPGTFETALITFEPFCLELPNTTKEALAFIILVGDSAKGQQLRVTITSDIPNALLVFEPTEITEDSMIQRHPTRLSFRFKEPLTRGTVTTMVEPN